MSLDPYHLMREALKEAEKALDAGEVPVGAVLADADGGILSRGHNSPIRLNDPTAHAEVLVIRAASEAVRNYRLPNTVLAVTVEPCVMCMGAALHARIARLFFGAPDPKAGAAGSLYDLSSDSRLNHRIEVVQGILQEECGSLMQRFFRTRRGARDNPSGEVPKWSQRGRLEIDLSRE